MFLCNAAPRRAQHILCIFIVIGDVIVIVM